jgi:lipoic acid synthetase
LTQAQRKIRIALASNTKADTGMDDSQELEKPSWIRTRLPSLSRYSEVREVVQGLKVHTVCDSAQCPNIGECWGRGTATFMILGEVCTRACRFCAVRSGDPADTIDDEEPRRVARAVYDLGLDYVVITSVTRDDLEDGGADHYSRTVREVLRLSPRTNVELLIPDLKGDRGALGVVVASGAKVIGHNLEVVERLQEKVRDNRASYRRSLHVLKMIKELDPTVLAKTSLMLGLGESTEEVVEAMEHARSVGVDIITLGQYLKPKGGSLGVHSYISPRQFDELGQTAHRLGFRGVISGPMVRSSYHADAIKITESEPGGN